MNFFRLVEMLLTAALGALCVSSTPLYLVPLAVAALGWSLTDARWYRSTE
jgi:hypothetical protein